MVDGFALDQTAVNDSWQHYLGGHLGQQQLFHKFDIASVIEGLSISMRLSTLQMISTAA